MSTAASDEIAPSEQIIAAIRADWGEAQASCDEFRFFSELRPSEQIALRTTDFDTQGVDVLATLRQRTYSS